MYTGRRPCCARHDCLTSGIRPSSPALAQAKSPLWTAILQPAEAADDVERFRDAPDPDDAPAAAPSEAAAPQPAASQLNGHRVRRTTAFPKAVILEDMAGLCVRNSCSFSSSGHKCDLRLAVHTVVRKPPFNAACPCAMQADGSDAEGSDDDAMGAAEPDPVAAAAAANAAEQDEQRAAAADKAGPPGEPAGGPPWPAPGAYDMHKRCGYWSRQHAACAALQA